MATNSEIGTVLAQSQQNFLITGASSSATSSNLLNTVTNQLAAIDVLSTTNGVSYRSMTVQITPSVASTATVLFEGSNDNLNFKPIYGVDQDYSQFGLWYSSYTWQTTTVSKVFELPLAYRYVRVRMVGSTAHTAIAVLKPSEMTNRQVGGFPPGYLLNKLSVSGSSGAATPSPGSGLRTYACSISVADGANGSVWDMWLCDGSGPSGDRLLTFGNSSTPTQQSATINPPSPLPGSVGSPLSVYFNIGSNMWFTLYYFVAP
jgi:hypothetical protein